MRSNRHCFQKHLTGFAAAACAVTLVFSPVLWAWLRFAAGDDLASYVLVIPLLAGMLVVRRWPAVEMLHVPAPRLAAGFGITAAAGLAAAWWLARTGGSAGPWWLAVGMLAYVSGLLAAAAGTVGRSVLKSLAFPAGLLVFLAPLPLPVVGALETLLQHASAEAAAWLFPLAGISTYREGLAFQLPEITLRVAPECSGIRSTLVLFITSLIAGYLFLDRIRHRVIFSALILPLGIARNAFRIVTIGWLCTYHGPEMIHSPIHHRGGPVFFALSMVPLAALLWIFRRGNRREDPATARGLVRSPRG